MRANGVSTPAPLLDVPDRFGPFPRDKVLWVLAGLLTLPCLIAIPPAADVLLADLRVFFVLWLVGAVACALLGFVRPGGLGLTQWPAALADYSLRPKRSVWWKD